MERNDIGQPSQALRNELAKEGIVLLNVQIGQGLQSSALLRKTVRGVKHVDEPVNQTANVTPAERLLPFIITTSR